VLLRQLRGEGVRGWETRVHCFINVAVTLIDTVQFVPTIVPVMRVPVTVPVKANPQSAGLVGVIVRLTLFPVLVPDTMAE